MAKADSANLSGIYAIHCVINGKMYIGSAVNFRKRWNAHRNDLDANRHHSGRLQNAWNKYGKDAFSFRVLEFVANKEDLIGIEQLYLDQFRTFKKETGYNISPTAGSQLGVSCTPGTKAKLSIARSGTKATAETRARMSAAQAKRKPHSSETRAKISAAKRNPNLETRARISEANRKREPPSLETRAKMSAAKRNPPPEVRAKMSAARQGRKDTTETRAKKSASHKGSKASPETRAKMSARLRGNTRCEGHKHTPETRAKISAAKSTPEARARASASLMGHEVTPETRAKQSAYWRRRREAVSRQKSAKNQAVLPFPGDDD